MPRPVDLFGGDDAATSGPLEGTYLWSDPEQQNWTDGIPEDGDDAVILADPVDDDLAAVSLSTLTLGTNTAGGKTHLRVTGHTLEIGTLLEATANTGVLDADPLAGQEAVTVSIDTIGTADMIIEATGAGAKVVVRTAVAQTETFNAKDGGEIEVLVAPSSSWTFDYGIGLFNTFAFAAPAASNAMSLVDVGQEDVLEVPGTSVGKITFGPTNLSIPTNAGVYAFTNVTYADPLSSYSAAVDPVTGLMAITFSDVDVFQRNVPASSGRLSGDYLWSNPANWSGNVPVDGDDVSIGADGYDDLAALKLATLTLDAAGDAVVHVTGESLTVANLNVSGSVGSAVLDADAADAGAPVIVTVQQVAAPGASLTATGAGAYLLDNSTTSAETTDYTVAQGGLVELSETPLATDKFTYTSSGTFAFKKPAATNLALLQDVSVGSTIEVPGGGVLGVAIGTNSVAITTDLGTYAFDSVVFATPITNIVASVDFSTVLQAVTFRGADTFTPTVQANAGQEGPQQFLWSNAANWTEGAPVNGDSILTTYKSLSTEYQLPIDDIQNLTLTGLTLALSNHVWVDHSLTVGTLTENYDTLIGAVSTNPVAPAVLTIGATIGAPYDSEIFASGAGATVIDRSTDLLGAYVPGMIYYVSLGGTLEFLSGAPAATSNFEFFDPTGEGLGGEGTIAFGAPGPVVAAALLNIAPKDVLELPGKSVSSVVFGTASLTVTTDAGTYAFTNVTYGDEVTDYTAAPDPATGLVAITFTGVDTFSDTVKAATGPLAGDFLWSNAANWSDGVPVDGSSVQYTPLATGYDDLAALNLSGLNIVGGQVWVTGGSLNVASISAGEITSGGTVYDSVVAADATDAGSPVAVTVGTITGTEGYFVADGAGASFVGPTAADPGHTVYGSEDGGVVRLPVTPADTSALNYGGGQSTVELDDPAATSNGNIFAPQPGDVLELPGKSVSNVTFGASSFDVTTDAGSYAFSNVIYGNLPVTGYTAAPDATTGLVAITFTGPDVFSANVKATSGPLAGKYLWSNAANWSQGVPIDGSAVQYALGAVGYDDLAVLNLSELNPNGGDVYVTGRSLTVSTLAGGDLRPQYPYVGTFTVDAADAGGPVTVTIGTITGTGGQYYAKGAGASFQDQSVTGPADIFNAEDDGLIQFAATPAGAGLEYRSGPSTFALDNPGTTNAVGLENVAPGDVLELPGTSVSEVSFGKASLSVTTSAGTYAFLIVGYDPNSPVTGYTAAPDATTGLVAITFTGPDVFSANVKATSGLLAGKYLWSNAANWSQGVPIDGSAVQYGLGAVGYDDLAALNLSELNPNGGDVYVTGRSLTVSTLAGGDLRPQYPYIGTFTVDAADAGGPVTVTIGTITGTGGQYYAKGAGASFQDQSATGPADIFNAEDDGLIQFAATPAGAGLEYRSGPSTFALDNPGTTNAVGLENVAPGDVLELPGTSVSEVSFGKASLSVTTSAGTYAFLIVGYDPNSPVTGYTAAPDPATGLVAITFTGVDTFSDAVKAATGPLAGDYLWSNAANWSDGVPVDGDDVSITQQSVSYDDIASLSLGTLTMNQATVNVVGSVLNVGTVVGGAQFAPTVAYSFLFADAVDAGAPVTVTAGDVTGIRSTYGATGAGGTFVDNSPTDPGNTYEPGSGGTVILAATQVTESDFWYQTPPGTVELTNLASITASDIDYYADAVLELPGSTVSSVSFLGGDVTVVTDQGSYRLRNDTSLTDYRWAPVAGTTLVAVTFTGVDIFKPNVKATSGKFAGDYLWSNPANWRLGRAPVGGDDVSVTQQSVSYDDIASLSVGTLTMNQATVNVVGSVLNVGTVVGGAQITPIVEYSFLYADAVDAGTPVTVTAGDVTGTRSTYGATGAGGTFVDNSPTDPGNTYEPGSGGTVILAATQVTESDFWYLTSPGTVALTNLASITESDIDYAADDVLELPGSTVSSVSFLGGDVTVVTDQGSYALRNDTSLTGYRWAAVAGTTLVAVMFLGPDTFEPNVKTTSGKSAGDYLWSNPANWSLRRAPIDGDDVSVTRQSVSYDDIAALSLGTLTMNQATVNVVSSVLTVGTVVGGEQITPTEFSFLFADAVDAGAPVTVTAGEVTGTRSTYGATGAGGTFVDNSPTDPGNTYLANNGGVLSLAATPDSTSDFYWLNGGPNTIELERPAATAGADFNYYASGDVLELPGASVSNVGFGPNSLGVTTDVGTYNFYILYEAAGAVNGYTAALDPSTGLVAITFTGVDTFSDNVKATSGPLSGKYLWNNAANWSSGAPVNGDSVAFTGGAVSDDDLAALSLSSLTIDNNAALTVTSGHLSVTGALTVGDVGGGSLTDSAGAEVTAASVAVGGQGRIVMAGGVLDPPIPISIAAGGSITGSGSIDGTVVATGTLAATGGLLKVDGAVSGTGTLAIGAGATLDLEGGAELTQGGAISFGGAGSKLVVGAGQSVSGTILGLGNGGDIDFAGQTVTTSYSQGVLTLLSGASTVGTLVVADTTAAEGFMTKADGQDGTDIVAVPSGTAVGDVHLMTFDGLHYNFQADGDFILARSTQTGNPFDVEIRTTPWMLNHLASLTTQAGAQVGSHVIDFMLDGSVKIDGIADTALSAAHPEQRLDGGTLTALGSGRYQLDWAGKEGLTVTNEGFYLNLQTTLAATDGPGSVQGLLGTLQGQASDLSLPDGTALKQPVPDATLLGAFADGWRVDAGASLLDGTVSLRPDTLGMPTSPNFLLADAPGELLTGSLGSAADASVIIGGSLANLAGAVITNFAPRDFIDVTNLAGANAAFQEIPSADGGQLTITGGFHSATLTLMGTGASAAVQYSSDHHGGTMLWVR